MKKMGLTEVIQVSIKIFYINNNYIIVRNKSKYLVELLSDSFKLKDEKKKFSSWKSRIEGVASEGVSSSSYSKKKMIITYMVQLLLKVMGEK